MPEEFRPNSERLLTEQNYQAAQPEPLRPAAQNDSAAKSLLTKMARGGNRVVETDLEL